MEEQKDMIGMLELILQPSFFVKQGTITLVNQAARQLLIEPQSPIYAILGNNSEEYTAFESGCLCLTLSLAGCPMQATVTRMDSFDLFVIDQSSDQAELKAMALTAMGIREPLSDIMTISEQLRPAIDQNENEQMNTRLAQMNRRLNQLHRIVCNMTDAIHYANEMAPKMVCQDVCSVLKDVFDHASELLERAGFRLTYSGPREAVYCMIEPNWLERAVYNILSNAIKNAAPGTLIEATLIHRGSKLYLSIQDNGPGIPSHLLGSVYSRYRRHPGIEAYPAGLGLGMVLVRGTAAAHGGAVLIDQPEGHGTRITLSLAIRTSPGTKLRSGAIHVDYAGERDHSLLELSDVLPSEFYRAN